MPRPRSTPPRPGSPKRPRRGPDKATVKAAAAGRWPDLLPDLAGIDPALLDGKPHPCPWCGGTDRFEVHKDFAETGGVFCRRCHDENGGDGFAAVMKATGRDFPAALAAVADRLGVTTETPPPPSVRSAKNEPAPPDFARSFAFDAEPDAALLAAWCAAKPPVTADAALAAGVTTGARRTRGADDGRRCVAFPARPAPGAEPVGWLLYAADGGTLTVESGKNAREVKSYNLPGTSDGWVFVGPPDEWEGAATRVRAEGVGDALALAPLLPPGWAVASNVCGATSGKCPVEPFAGGAVVAIGDADEPGRRGAAKFAKRVGAVAASVAVAELPFAVRPDGGEDVRDFLNAAADPAANVADLFAGAVPVADEPADDEPGGGAKPVGGGGGDEKERPPSHATRMVELADAAGADPFHDAEGEPFVTFDGADGERQTYRLRTRAVRDWLAQRLYAADGAAPGSEATESALNVLAARAKFEGDCRPVAVRMAPLPVPSASPSDESRGVALDLGDPDWRCVVVTAGGWEVRSVAELGDECAARFVRPKGLLPLPEPERGGTLAELRPFVNVASDADFALLLGWLAAAFMTDGPFPVLILNGEQGCAKSTTAKVLRRLIDPNKADLRRPPQCTRDLVIAAKNGHVVALENLSAVKAELSDDLCSLATGGGFAVREHYTNDEEALFAFRRPVILNGIPTLADRPDLLDRAVTLVLPVIPPDARKAERQFWPTFEAARPRLLGAVLDAVALALRNLPTVELAGSPRMADFAAWAVAAEPAFPVPPGTFLAAYADARESAHEVALEGEVIAGPVRELAARGAWTGAAAELLAELGSIAGETAAKGRLWPKAPNALSGRLRRIAPDLRAAGVGVEFDTDARPRTIRLAATGAPAPGTDGPGTVATVGTDEPPGFADPPPDGPDRRDRRGTDGAGLYEPGAAVGPDDADGPAADRSGDGGSGDGDDAATGADGGEVRSWSL